jgi:hypothetical protein
MPCDARRLLRQRFRGYGDEVALVAQERWESDAVSASELREALGAGPLDARVWLGMFPFDALASASVEAAHGRRAGGAAPAALGDAGALPPPEGPLYRALASLSRVDAADAAIIIDGIRGAFDAASWRAGLGASDLALADRLALALYRALALRFDVVGLIANTAEREALIARRFAPDDGGDIGALAMLRAALGDPTITIVSLRAWYRDAAEASLAKLEANPEVGAVLSPAALVAFRRALKLDGARPAEPATDGHAFDEPLFMLLSRDIARSAPRTVDAHPRARDLARFALGAVTSPTDAARLVEHLVACRDGRCNDLVRAEVSGREAVRAALAGPMSEPPAATGAGLAPGVMLGPSSPHMIRCRDVLWETFSSMARAEGTSVDVLVEDAMDRYRALRTHVKEDAGRRPRPSSPPDGRGTGLHLGGQRTSSPPLESTPEAPPVDLEEPTKPNIPLSDLEDEERTTPRS